MAARLTGLTAAAALWVLLLPGAAGAQGTAAPKVVHYATGITTAYGSPYPIAGHLDLEMFADGTLRGYYHNAYVKAFIPVVGGQDGSYMWFDILPSPVDLGMGLGNGRYHVVGTVNSDGSFRGQIYPEFDAAAASMNAPQYGGSRSSPAIGSESTAGTGVADQYVFAAKPIDRSSEDYPFTQPSASPSP